MKKTRKINRKGTERQTRASASERRLNRTRHIGASLMAGILLSSTLLMSGALPSYAGNGVRPYAATQDTTLRAADRSTVDTFGSFLLDKNSARYAGRIWTDKSVYALGINDRSRTVTIDGKTVSFEEDFLEVFSAMGSTLQVNGEEDVPMDVMIVLDMSGSMGFEANERARLKNAVEALDSSFEYLMENEKNRVGLYIYSGVGKANTTNPSVGDGTEVLALGRYEQRSAGNNTGTTYYRGKYFDYSDVKKTTLTNMDYGNGTQASYQDASLNVHVTKVEENNTKTDIVKSIAATGATNTQMGLHAGMNALANAAKPKEGELSERQPVVILITDGQPTVSYKTNWWDPANRNGNEFRDPLYQGDGNGNYWGHGMLTMATGTYMRKPINDHYNISEDAANSLKVITIGLDMDHPSMTTNGGVTKEFALTTLNPKERLTKEFVDAVDPNDAKTTAIQIYNAFYGNNGYLKNTGANWYTEILTKGKSETQNYKFKHPTYGGRDIDTLAYNDVYQTVNVFQGDDLAKVLKDIVVSMQSTINVPIEGMGDNLVASTANMLSYSDPIGEYLDVKDVFKLFLLGQVYDIKPIATVSGHYADYAISGADQTITNLCYGTDSDKTFKLSDIKIWIEEKSHENIKDSKGNSLKMYTLRVDIPAAAVPVRTATVNLNKDKQVESYTTNIDGIDPLRLFYTVGVQEGYLLKNSRTVDLNEIDSSYKQSHRDPVTGHVYFYANYFKGAQYIYSGGADYDMGDALTTFSPADTNRYYIYQEYLPLYTDKNNNQSYVTSYNGISSDGTYYFDFPYYTSAKDIQYAQIERLGSMFGSGVPGGGDDTDYHGFGEFLVWYNPTSGKDQEIDNDRSDGGKPSGDGWIIATKKGGIRVGNMGDHSEDGFKDDGTSGTNGNVTQTSSTYYLPTVSGSTKTDNVVLTSYLGNNGVLSVSDAEIMITKEVVYDPGQVTEDMIAELKAEEEFNYTLKLPNSTFTGKLEAIVITQDEQSAGCNWRARIEQIALVPNNQGLLVSSTGRLATTDDGRYYLYIGQKNPVLFQYDSENGGLVDGVNTDLKFSGVRLLPKEKYNTSGSVNENDLVGDAIEIKVGTVNLNTSSIGSEITTTYKLSTTYQTRIIEFKDGQADFKLKHLTGLLFSGISEGAYEVTEVISERQTNIGIDLNRVECEVYKQIYDANTGTFQPDNNGKPAERFLKGDSNSGNGDILGGTNQFGHTFDDPDYSIDSQTSADEVHHIHYYNDYTPASLIIPKTVVGTKNEDKFIFEITLTAPAGTEFLGYYAAYIHPSDHKVGDISCEPSDHTSLKFALKYKTKYTFELDVDPKIILKDGEEFVILGLPAGTHYEIKEVIRHNDDSDASNNYQTDISVTNRDNGEKDYTIENDKRTAKGVLNSEIHRIMNADGTSVGHINPLYVRYQNANLEELPKTGGPGVWIFYTAGGILLLTALPILYRRKRRAQNG